VIEPSDLPSVNAVLNATSAVLLMVGYAAIRRRAIGVHKVCMLGALAVSTAFLACYIFYHFVVRRGQPTLFLAVGWIRPVYFSLLFSHMVLAASLVLLVPVTAYRGLRMLYKLHVRLARWTLPIWLYVSVTGVVVYWMLYHLYPSP
jgi:uncharacterized membrane protein YozB (DUF420 family)